MSYIVKSHIDDDVVKDFEEIKKEANKILVIDDKKSIGYNNLLILQKIKEKKSGIFVQCGVHKGWTLIPAILYCQKYGYDFTFHGFDTFGGFPDDVTSNPKDNPKNFIELYENDVIDKEHFNKAKKRTNNFKSQNHLTENYFEDIGNILIFESYFMGIGVTYHSGTFSETLPKFKEDIDILHLDCDLYQSYLDVLNNVYNNVNETGSVIFDEYYSLKYPGARIAVNEFFSNHKSNHFEKYITPYSFERWCAVK